jgi:hypothetical protein
MFELQLGKIKKADSSVGEDQSRDIGNTAHRQANVAEACLQLLSDVLTTIAELLNDIGARDEPNPPWVGDRVIDDSDRRADDINL